MKVISIYEANDGTRFDTKKECEEYEILLFKCELINAGIGKEVKLEYDQFVQHDIEKVTQEWIHFCRLVGQTIPNYSKLGLECAYGKRHHSHIYRVISDSNIKCFENLAFRFQCIDEYGCEFQQPYFANGHQNEATREVVL